MKFAQKTTLLIFFLIITRSTVIAQLIDSHLKVSLGYQTGIPMGKDTNNNQGLITPSVFGNLDGWSGLQAKALYQLNSFAFAGLGISSLSAGSWSHNNYKDYMGATLRQNIISPTIQIRSRWNETGILNRLTGFCEVAPSLGMTSISLQNPVFEVYQDGQLVEPIMRSNDFLFGISLGLGVEYSINRAFGLTISYSFDYMRVNSVLYNDKAFGMHSLKAGLFFRFLHDKRYFY
jgi:hypothetical protein